MTLSSFSCFPKALAVTMFLAWFPGPATAGSAAPGDKTPQTVIKDQVVLDKLLGKHLLALQWISWSHFGTVEVVYGNGTLTIAGSQESRKGNDYIRIDGVIPEVGTSYFKFRGTIVTRVSHINGGRPCRRQGLMTFRVTGKRKYWRLKQMDNPCDGVTDYVDVFFQRPAE
jgi:hypothetical protein